MAEVSDGRKAVIAQHLVRFYAYKHIPFDKPRYVPFDTLPFIPLENEVDQLISGVGKKTAAYLQLVKETGARAGEAWNLRWIDINNEAGTVTITPEKRSRARQFKVSGSLIVMLTRLPHDEVWYGFSRNLSTSALIAEPLSWNIQADSDI